MSRFLQILTTFIFVAVAPQVSGDACLERIVTQSDPIFPRIFCGARSVKDYEHCFNVRLSYNLSADGKAQDIAVLDGDEACSSFARSVEKTLLKAVFAPGKDEKSCTYEYAFTLEP